MAKILFFVTEDWYFCTHRLPLAIAAKEAGHDVVVLTRVNAHGDLIRSHGLTLEHLEFSRKDRNPFKEFVLLLCLAATYRRLNPDLAHHVALKPVVYGSVAAYFSGASPRIVNAITGLGYVFISRQVRARLLRPWLRLACRLLLNRGASRVIIQNPDDRALLLAQGMVTPERITLIRGAGVDTEVFAPKPESEDTPLIILPARLLWDKGVGEFVAAARTLRAAGVNARFALVGDPDPENPSGVSDEQIQAWVQEGVVEWWGRRDDMPSVYAQSHIVCLPSYREGLPKSLLEAAACARPIVTTDAPGCREIVRHEQNGLLVPMRDAKALTKALNRLIDDPKLRTSMGTRGREIVLAEFAVQKVIDQTLSLYREVLA